MATRLLAGTERPATADRDINAMKQMGTIPDWTVNHFLSDVNAWFLQTDVPNGAKMFVRMPLKTAMEGDFETGNTRYKARERYRFGLADALGYYGSPGSS